MDSALEAARELNSSNIPSSITFLSGNVLDKSKARYNATAYSELARRISRSGIKSSMHVRLEQLGSEFDEELAVGNAMAVAESAGKYGVFMWIDPNNASVHNALKLSKLEGVGLAINVARIDEYIRSGPRINFLKMSFKDYEYDRKELQRRVAEVRKSVDNLVLSSFDSSIMRYIVRSKRTGSIAFELGYGDRKIKRASKKGVDVSVLVPFGKDWIRYAMNNVPEGYMRFVAGKLLKERVA